MYGYVYRLVQASIFSSAFDFEVYSEFELMLYSKLFMTLALILFLWVSWTFSFQQDRLLCPREAALWRAVSYSIGNVQLFTAFGPF